MLRILKNKKIISQKAQMISSEYVIVFFVAIAVISGMSAYFRRAIQARVRDAHNSMLNTVRTRVGTAYAGTNVYIQYEPYYTSSVSDVVRTVDNISQDLPSYPLSSGIFRKSLSETTSTGSVSTTASPVNAD
ncbi:MAG: hypothetical protein AB7S78_05210 [Candidatus Omnitrophota bacterium]